MFPEKTEKAKSHSLQEEWEVVCDQDLRAATGINFEVEIVRVVSKSRKVVLRVCMEKEYSKHFLRLNNRKQFHSVQDLKKEGYPSITVPYRNRDDALVWCKKHLPKGSFCFYSCTFWFPTEKHATLFSLTWG